MKIDFHTHVYPGPVAAKAVREVCQRSGIEAYADGTLEGLKRSMAAAGIDLSVVAAVATKPEQVASIQKWLTAIRQPGIETLAALHPDDPLSSGQPANLRRQGFRGFKLHPDYQDFFVDDPRMYPLYEAAAAEGMFILFHAGMDRGLPHPVHATPQRLATVRKAVPELCMVVAHLGGEESYGDTALHLLGRTSTWTPPSYCVRCLGHSGNASSKNIRRNGCCSHRTVHGQTRGKSFSFFCNCPFSQKGTRKKSVS